ncbi:MAG: RNA methyltransferase [Acidobacteria bacterium]|nr:RNA methyltransferase [Acidobacteriota bacterium]
MVEGRTLIQEALASGWEIESLYSTQGNDSGIGAAPCFQVSPQVLQSISTLQQAPGLLAVARKRLFALDCVALGRCSLLLDGIQDPGNVGTLLRSAAAFGVQGVLAAPGTAHFYNPKVVRAAMGALFHLQLCEKVEPHEIRLLLQSRQVQLLIADSKSGEDPKDLPLDRRYMLVLGHETLGASAQWLEMSHRRVRIRLAPAVESLNVAVAGSILLYELAARCAP